MTLALFGTRERNRMMQIVTIVPDPRDAGAFCRVVLQNATSDRAVGRFGAFCMSSAPADSRDSSRPPNRCLEPLLLVLRSTPRGLAAKRSGPAGMILE